MVKLGITVAISAIVLSTAIGGCNFDESKDEVGVSGDFVPAAAIRMNNSEYCARLFGPANAIDKDGKTRWLRPEQFSICADGDSGGLRGEILRFRNVGRYWEIQAQMESAKSDTWLLHSDLQTTPTVGKKISVRWQS